MRSIIEIEDSERALNIGNGSRVKRMIDEEFEPENRENRRKKVRVPEEMDKKFGALGKVNLDVGDQVEGFENGLVDVEVREFFVCEKSFQDTGTTTEQRVEVINITSGESDAKEEKIIDVECFRQNRRGKKVKVPEEMDEEFGVLGKVNLDVGDQVEGFENGLVDVEVREVCKKSFQDTGMTTERRVEVIDITSGESDAEEEKIIDVECFRQKDKQISKSHTYGSLSSFSLGFGMRDRGQAVGRSSSVNGGTRYTKEDKGKAKVDGSGDCWLSLVNHPIQLNIQPLSQELRGTGQHRETISLLGTESKFKLEAEPVGALAARAGNAVRQYPFYPFYHHNVRSHTANRLARSKYELKDCTNQSDGKEQNFFSLRVDEQLGSVPGPFSIALKTIRERSQRKSAQELIEWKPSKNGDCKTSSCIAPSLLNLSLRVLAENAEAIISLKPVPHILRRKLTDVLCNIRRMNTHILDLLLEGSPPELYIKDCSWLAEDQFIKSFKNFDGKNLMVLQLDLCGQCTFDYVLGETFARSSNSLPNLGIISLKGACRLTDSAVKALVTSAPGLLSINLAQCSLLTEAGVKIIADFLGPILRELYIDECQSIDAMVIVPALLKFKHLEVLSVAGVQTVCDQFVHDIITACGRNLKELNLADCLRLTNYSLKVIASTCVDLRSLNISKLDKVTDLGIEYLANGCRSIQTLKLLGNKFSDEAIAAFLEVAGKSIEELSLNNVSKVGPNTALSLAKRSRNLLSLDLSWCRGITNEALGLIVDNCLSLRLVKLFGCRQITEVFLNGHSNSLVRIVGLSKTPILENLDMLQPEEVLLRYSPFPISSVCQNVDQQGG